MFLDNWLVRSQFFWAIYWDSSQANSSDIPAVRPSTSWGLNVVECSHVFVCLPSCVIAVWEPHSVQRLEHESCFMTFLMVRFFLNLQISLWGSPYCSALAVCIYFLLRPWIFRIWLKGVCLNHSWTTVPRLSPRPFADRGDGDCLPPYTALLSGHL